MSKARWKEVITRYQAATGLIHDLEQFQNRRRQLRSQWLLCNKLRYGSGLGLREDGSVGASESWWKDHTNVKSLVLISLLLCSA
jgi:hypothetical protein